ncbi:MAG: hypothetical protein JRE21_00070 [Deltaproteobacteria bacterium]|jgi:hypothetical protein|nr:hypothetical protein [Deltaproteobacteria bacterium]
MKAWFATRALTLCSGCLLVFFGAVSLPPAAAEPTPAIQFLMKEPVSMMDWGLKNIEDHLYRQRALFVRGEKPLFEPEPNITVAYDWEINQIRISIGLRACKQVQTNPQGLSHIQTHVEWVIKYLRGSLTLKPYDAFFRHRGFRSNESPRGLESELADLTILIVSVRDGEANILSRCEARLTGADMTWLSIGEP